MRIQRETGSRLWDEGGGKVASRLRRALAILPKPSKNVDKQIPGNEIFLRTRLDLPLIVLFTVTIKDASLLMAL